MSIQPKSTALGRKINDTDWDGLIDHVESITVGHKHDGIDSRSLNGVDLIFTTPDGTKTYRIGVDNDGAIFSQRLT